MIKSAASPCSSDFASLTCELDRPRLADDRHLDLAGVVELLLDRPGDVAADA